jgi:glycosyltransferase involved in cell wall biosynthesis
LTTSVDFGGIEKVLLTLFRHVDRHVELIPVVFARSDARDLTFLDQLHDLGLTPRLIYIDKSRLQHLSPIRHCVDTMAILRRERFDVIHSHGYRADLIGLPLSRYFGVPIVSTCHGFTPNDRRLALYSRMDVLALRHFNRVIAVSNRMRDDILVKGLSPARINVIANATSPVCEEAVRLERQRVRDRLYIADDEFVFGFVGRLSEEKGLQQLLDAVHFRQPTEGAWRLLVVGEGPRRQQLESTASRRGLSAKIVFAGFQRDTSPWFSAMDAFVLPSLTEGTPMALLEAMAHRVPVVATAVGGVPSIISDRINGMLVPAADPPALASALREVSSDPEFTRSLARAGYETVCTRYDVQSWVAKVRAVYEQALNES